MPSARKRSTVTKSEKHIKVTERGKRDVSPNDLCWVCILLAEKKTIFSDWLEKADSQFERTSEFFRFPSDRCSLRIVQNACASGEPWTSLLVRLEHRKDTVITICTYTHGSTVSVI